MVKKHRSTEDVTLNVTAMLDMAFQLLAFFILTFRPPPGEGDLLEVAPATTGCGHDRHAEGGCRRDQRSQGRQDHQVVDDQLGRPQYGTISSVQIGIPSVSMKPVPYNDLEKELRGYFKAKEDNDSSGQKGNSLGDYEQVVINASPTLRWDQVMNVMELCTKFTTTANGKIPSVSLSAAGPDPGN